ncbi:MAG: D-tyrosyl-tRNA(Tyr) deacylase [Candidatus Actinomarinales bacterium]|nr:MAG: D-tyrosyl-tRNA(Tyr) deacylase [Acidimicrobiaceae bacterium TMED210]RZP25407.1 MAG: D-tyrosyl-tRNA(Tyr) deacylase [Candidatus Actinomarinales bacterium]|tara:strand:+ start:6489 stop:6953 length:465 start_codon:yes stop_codon:yes gene_type:complete
MKVVLQRVKSAYVKVDSVVISEIDNGYLLLWGIEESDSEVESEILINKILNFRVFSDENLKMNKSITDISGEILIVSQFTLAGKFLKGNRPSFVNAKSPEIAEKMILKIVEEFSKHVTVKTGSFGAMMDVGLVNDGPATFVLTARNGQLIDQAD